MFTLQKPLSLTLHLWSMSENQSVLLSQQFQPVGAVIHEILAKKFKDDFSSLTVFEHAHAIYFSKHPEKLPKDEASINYRQLIEIAAYVQSHLHVMVLRVSQKETEIENILMNLLRSKFRWHFNINKIHLYFLITSSNFLHVSS